MNFQPSVFLNPEEIGEEKQFTLKPYRRDTTESEPWLLGVSIAATVVGLGLLYLSLKK